MEQSTHFWTRDTAENKKVSAHQGRFESTFENISYDPERCKARKGRTIILWCLSPWSLAPMAWARVCAITYIKLYVVFPFPKRDLGQWPRITPLFMIHVGDLGYVKGSWVLYVYIRDWNWGSDWFDYTKFCYQMGETSITIHSNGCACKKWLQSSAPWLSLSWVRRFDHSKDRIFGILTNFDKSYFDKPIRRPWELTFKCRLREMTLARM